MKHLHWSLIIALVGRTAIAYSSRWSDRPIPTSTEQTIPSIVQGLLQQGDALVGAILTSFDEQGRSLTLKIEDVQPDPQDVDREVYLYTVLYRSIADDQWHYLCQPDPTGVAKATPLAGRWDQTGAHINDDSITFACTNGALAKCVRWGYKPWKTVNGESLRDYHQACTRLVRADYCGNGVGHTQDGTLIDVYDRLGIQQRTKKSGMSFEAAWNVDGAVYLKRTRFPEAITQLQKDCPEKLMQMLPLQESGDPYVDVGSLASIANALLFNDSFYMRR